MTTIKITARELRKNQTKSEQIVWELLRNRRLSNYKFFRQHIIRVNYFGERRHFIADFYCPKKKLVLEIDGKIHEKQQEYDELRTEIINQLGINVVRIKNNELEDINSVINKIKMHL